MQEIMNDLNSPLFSGIQANDLMEMLGCIGYHVSDYGKGEIIAFEEEHVRDFEKIAAYGVMTTPALVVDGKVVSYGKVLKKEEVVEILKKVRG